MLRATALGWRGEVSPTTSTSERAVGISCIDIRHPPKAVAYGAGMDVLSTTLAVVIALVCLATAAADFKVLPQIVETMERLRMPIRIIPALGAMKVAGALGLLMGFWIDALGSYAAFCLSIYFLIATGLHVRVRDGAAHTAPAAVLFVLSVVTFITSF
ncbi:MAG: hypothetical protein RLZZ362_1191 [Actinomycetota bacterium]|jgi:hypothetical protein